MATPKEPPSSPTASFTAEPTPARFYVNLDVADRPGVLAAIAAAFAQHGVSIQVVRQDGHGDNAGLVVRTHLAGEDDLERTVAQLRGMSEVKAVLGVMRVEGEAGA